MPTVSALSRELTLTEIYAWRQRWLDSVLPILRDGIADLEALPRRSAEEDSMLREALRIRELARRYLYRTDPREFTVERPARRELAAAWASFSELVTGADARAKRAASVTAVAPRGWQPNGTYIFRAADGRLLRGRRATPAERGLRG